MSSDFIEVFQCRECKTIVLKKINKELVFTCELLYCGNCIQIAKEYSNLEEYFFIGRDLENLIYSNYTYE